MSPIKWVLAGGLAAGALDITDAFIVFSLKGIKFMSITQAITAGLIGPAAFKGGVVTFLEGLALHFAMAVVMALVFYAIVRAVPILAKNLVITGLVYGLGLFFVMNYLVVPNSQFQHGKFPEFPPTLDLMTLNALFCHIILVGLTIALFTRKGLQNG